MRAKIAHILSEDAIKGFEASSNELADQILYLISEEIEKNGAIKSHWVKAGSKKRKNELNRLTIADMEQANDIDGIIEVASKRAAQAQLDKILTLLKE